MCEQKPDAGAEEPAKVAPPPTVAAIASQPVRAVVQDVPATPAPPPAAATATATPVVPASTAQQNGAKHGAENGDQHEDVCTKCYVGGELVCCDRCPRTFHVACAGLDAIPEGDWVCRVCSRDDGATSSSGLHGDAQMAATGSGVDAETEWDDISLGWKPVFSADQWKKLTTRAPTAKTRLVVLRQVCPLPRNSWRAGGQLTPRCACSASLCCDLSREIPARRCCWTPCQCRRRR